MDCYADVSDSYKRKQFLIENLLNTIIRDLFKLKFSHSHEYRQLEKIIFFHLNINNISKKIIRKESV